MAPMSTPGVTFAAPGLTLSTSNAAGSAATTIRSDATVATFDAAVPTTITSGASAAAGSAGVAARRDHTHGVPTLATAATYKYKSATQTASATTAYATVTAASGNFDFAIAANEVWVVDILLMMTFTSTGGLKFQFTGPGSPTAVNISGWRTGYSADLSTSQAAAVVLTPFTTVTAFSSDVAAFAAGGTGTLNVYPNDISNRVPVYVHATIANGANAGTVTFQFAQNSGAGTAVINIGSCMTAQRIA